MNGRWFALAAAVGLLYIGIDRTFFDRIVGSGPLARIERILTILAGTFVPTENPKVRDKEASNVLARSATTEANAMQAVSSFIERSGEVPSGT